MAYGTRGKPLHSNGTATATPARVKVRDVADAMTPPFKASLAWGIRLRNLDGANPLQISFDNGTAYFTIPAASATESGSLELDARFTSFVVRRGGAANVAYEAILIAG